MSGASGWTSKTSTLGVRIVKIKLNGNQCENCKKTHENCADGRQCPKWRLSYDVCIVFGTRPPKPGFNGAAITR